MRPRDALAMLVMVLVAGGLVTARGAGADASDPAGTTAGEDTGARSATARNDLRAVAPQRGRAVEEERDPGRGPRPTEPVFIEPAATTTKHTRLGLSTWIAPGAPAENRENPGGIAIGLTIAWPPPPRDVPSSGPSAWRGSAGR
jgi:hypothetical protein